MATIREFQRGYNEALRDLLDALTYDGIEGAVQWAKNNAHPDFRAAIEAQADRVSATYRKADR